MKTLRTLVSAAVLCSGVLALSGCHSSSNETGGIPVPAPHAAPSPQAQAQEVDSNPHIPDAQKAAIKANIARGGGAAGG